MIKMPPRWFLISLIHPFVSLLGFAVVWAIFVFTSPMDAWWLKKAYAIMEAVFIINMPGHLLLQAIYETPVDSTWVTYAVTVLMVILSWALFVMPVCWCVREWGGWLKRVITRSAA